MKRAILTMALVILVVLCSCATGNGQIPDDTRVTSGPIQDGAELIVIFFDVGQADCILVKDGERSMLIDAGNTGQDELVLGYLSEYDVESLDFLVATHPHADHIGSMAAVIRGMGSIGTLLMPDVIHTTQTFENLLDAIDEKGVTVVVPKPGDVFALGGARMRVLAPNSGSYDELNNYSVVLRLDYGQSSFLFTGDAEEISEAEQLAGNHNLDTDILKVAHHGSVSSSSEEYLEAVSPEYAVISCGKDNTYGHPHGETLERLAAIGGTLYRTDENGRVVFTTDGKTLTAYAERESAGEREEHDDTTDNVVLYIGNVNSRVFHSPDCGTLPSGKNRLYFASRDAATDSGYRACKNCRP